MKKITLQLTERQSALLVYALESRIELDQAHKDDGFWNAEMAQDFRGLKGLKDTVESKRELFYS
jgi:hypothetical protein